MDKHMLMVPVKDMNIWDRLKFVFTNRLMVCFGMVQPMAPLGFKMVTLVPPKSKAIAVKVVGAIMDHPHGWNDLSELPNLMPDPTQQNQVPANTIFN